MIEWVGIGNRGAFVPDISFLSPEIRAETWEAKYCERPRQCLSQVDVEDSE
jgi:hypothetical protein